MSVSAKDYEKLWGDLEMRDALRDAVSKAATGYAYIDLKEIVENKESTEMLDIEELEEVDKTVNLLGHMFEYYGVKRLSEGFDKLEFASQMYMVGAIIHRFTAGLPDGSGFSKVTMGESDWECFLVRKDAGYDKEVNALIAASEE